ncbi:MAG: methyltransferase domain-containing protein [Actinomycetota bacterium]|nr:methyltransferase domain-containing protein [Actinomycetota bacterium]
MARSWDAGSYHRVAGPLEAMGLAVLERLALAGDETVLDAGCGTGRVTAHLLRRLPRGRVIGVDLSADMLAQARGHLGDRVDLRVADLTELVLDEPVDAVFSTATFHWIHDHDRLFARLFAALRPGGRFVAQCGGDGNVAGVLAVIDRVGARSPFAPSFAGWTYPVQFAAPEATAARLAAAGFVDVDCWLQPFPVAPAEPLEYLRTVILGPHLERLPDHLRGSFVEQVAAALPVPITIDYLRLNIAARRPAHVGAKRPR